MITITGHILFPYYDYNYDYTISNNMITIMITITRRRRMLIETKYIRRETLAMVYKNRSREGHPAISI